MTREQVLRHPAYWFEYEQNELFRQVTSYMQSEGINRTQLAERLKVSKGYVSQILNGNFNYTLKKWIELCLAIGIVPGEYRKIEDVIKGDAEFALSKKDSSEKKSEIQNESVPGFQPQMQLAYFAYSEPNKPFLKEADYVFKENFIECTVTQLIKYKEA